MLNGVDGLRKELMEETISSLSEHGFEVSELDLAGLSAYDIIARSQTERFVIKVLYNIDTLRNGVALEILRISKLMGGAALVVGRRSSVGDMERGIMYFRHGVPMLSVETFSDYLSGRKPYIFSGPGGYYVPIDGQKMHRVRIELGLSIGYVSTKVGISRRSISLYESGNAATIDVLNKIENLLDDEIRQEMNLVEITRSTRIGNQDYQTDDTFLKEVITLLENVGYSIYPTQKAPYDAVACEREDFLFTLGAIRALKEEINRINAIVKASAAMEKEFLLVSPNETEKVNVPQNIVSITELRDSCDHGNIKPLLERNRYPP